MDCIFCKIVNGEIPSDKVYEDEFVLAFNDIQPAAPVHVLVIPKKHIESVVALTEEDDKLIAHIFKAIRVIAKEQGLENGFRLVSNVGADGGQSVKHLHFHILGKKQFTENFG
ncbi:MAG: histidine triad nucleotide-binding protein [Clostridiales bacterium]|nr:histidine triad nucleotide-binding protein [Clostridiales bacterium]